MMTRPELKSRMLSAEKLPPVFWIKRKEGINELRNPWKLVTEIDGNTIWVDNGWYNVTFETHVWSPDRKEILSFEVEEA